MCSTFATLTANTLDASACRQITRFLRQSAGYIQDGSIADSTPEEAADMVAAADALDRVLTWQGKFI